MWPFTRRRTPSTSPDADAAVEQADRALIDARNLDDRIDRVAQEAAEIRRLNHIAASVARTLRGI